MDKGKGLSNSPPKKKKTSEMEMVEQFRKRLKRMGMLSSSASKKWDTETTTTTEGTETDASIYGTETEVEIDDSIVLTEGSSTGIKEEIKQIIHEEEEEEKKKSKAADSSSDNTFTSAFPPPTSSTDKSLASGKDESMKSPPGDQGSC